MKVQMADNFPITGGKMAKFSYMYQQLLKYDKFFFAISSTYMKGKSTMTWKMANVKSD